MMISWEVGKFCKEAEFLEFSCKEQRMVIFTFTCTEHISLSKYYQIFFRCIFFYSGYILYVSVFSSLYMHELRLQ